MKNKLAIVLIAVCFCSCQHDLTKTNRELIIGDWYALDGDYLDFNRNSYQFMADNLCENKTGFYSYFYPDGLRLDHNAEVRNDSAWFCNYRYLYNLPPLFSILLFNVNRAYGNKTTYLVEQDTLQIFDLAKQKWLKYHISFGGRDTLKLSYQHEDLKINFETQLTRISYPEPDPEPLFDQFIFYTPSSCNTEEKSLLIRRDGLFFSYGYFETGRFFIARMQPDVFEQLETKFKQANFQEVIDSLQVPVLNRKYISSYESSVTLVTKDHKISTIDEPLGMVPYEFEWAYLSGVFLPDLIQELKPYFHEEYPALLTELNDFNKIKIKEVKLFCSERFYLGVLLCYANEVEDITIEPKYTLTLIPDEKVIMQSDGRYFRYTNKKGKEITLDIGFNFMEVNGLDKAVGN